MKGLLVLLFLVLDVVSLVYAGDVAAWAGISWKWWYSLLAVIGMVFVGIWTIRLGGAWSAMQAYRAAQLGRIPGRELLDGLFYLVAGGLFIMPGFLSDAIALILLFPLTRWPIRAIIVASFKRKAMRSEQAEEPRVVDVPYKLE